MFKFHPEIAKEWADKYGTKKKPKDYKPGPKENQKKKRTRKVLKKMLKK